MGAMNDDDDMTLLRAWARERSEAAFRAVVERYAGLVFGVALRRTGERPLAEEAVQNVFTDLAKKAAVIVELQRPLAAWLHRCAVYEAATLLRSEIRHREKMKHFANTSPGEPAPDPWQEVRPLLDDAINALSEPDRRVLLLHWFDRRTFADIAEKTGSTTAAAQRRGFRALDKLAAVLRRRGTVIPVAILAAGLTPQLSHAAPAGLAAAVSTAAIHAAPAAGVLTLFIQQSLSAMSSAKLTTAAIVLISAAIPVSVRLADSYSSDPSYSSHASPLTDGKNERNGRNVATAASTTLDLSLVKQAINRLLANPDNYDAQLELRRLMFSLSVEEVPGVLDLLMAVPGKKKESLYDVCHALFARWAELDPRAAAQAALDVPKSAYGYYPLRGAFITWAAADLDSAWAWLEKTTTDSMDREFLGGEALATIAADQTKSAAVMARVDAMTDANWRQKMRYWVARAWVQTTYPPAAMEWAAKLPDESERTEWIAKTVELTGEHNPLSGLSQLHRIETSARLAEVAHNILWPWLLAQPQEAFSELEKHTADWPIDLFRDAGDALTRHDSAKALEAARRLPEGPVREEFVQGMLSGVSYSDATAIIPALGMISEDKLLHHGGLGNFTGDLTKQNPAAAAKWITSLSPLSDTRKYADSQFESITGRAAADYLNTLPK